LFSLTPRPSHVTCTIYLAPQYPHYHPDQVPEMGNCISWFRGRSRRQTVSTTTRNQRTQPMPSIIVDQPVEDEVIASTVTSLRSQSEEPSRDDLHDNDGLTGGIADPGTSMWNIWPILTIGSILPAEAVATDPPVVPPETLGTEAESQIPPPTTSQVNQESEGGEATIENEHRWKRICKRWRIKHETKMRFYESTFTNIAWIFPS